MANAVASYNRNHDPNMMAIWAYLQESAQSTAAQQQQQQQPPPQQTTSGAAPPLPPLVPTRRTSAQNLPPVRNLLTHPEEWRSEGVQQLQGEGVSGSNAKVVMCGNSADFVKVSNLAMGTTAGGSEEGGDMMGKSVDKPLKRGPKGPRKYTAPRPLGPLKLLAPKLSDKEGEAESVRTTKKTRQRKRPASKATITSDPAPKSSTDSNIRPTAEVGDNGFTMNTAPETGISQAFNVPDYGSVMEPSMRHLCLISLLPSQNCTIHISALFITVIRSQLDTMVSLQWHTAVLKQTFHRHRIQLDSPRCITVQYLLPHTAVMSALTLPYTPCTIVPIPSDRQWIPFQIYNHKCR